MYSWRKLREKLFTGLVIALSLLAIAPVLHLIATVFVNGLTVIAEAGLGFFTGLPPTPLSRELGGIAPSIAGTLIMTALSLPSTVLLGLFAAILTTEFPKNPLSVAIDAVAKSLASIPTIAVSMIVYTLVVIPMRGFSALAGAIALTIIALPYAYTYFSTALRSVPSIYREAAFAVAMSRWSTVTRVFIPIARRSAVVGVLMTMARVMGETAALLFTAGRFRASVALSPTAPADSIPLLIFDYILSPYTIWHRVAWGATALLLIAYMAVFIATKLVVKEVKL
uniref:ABC transporter permease subunit n=1 Tax=Ignisphaera aggregans TaxID=334771 RepID=A0A7J3ZAG5_9CREN